MSWGMTWEQFWFGDCDAAPMYRKAARLREKQRDYEFWLQGLYFREAVNSSVGNAFLEKGAKPFEYPSEPFSSSEKDKKQELTEEEREDLKHKKDDDRFMAYMTEWMSSVNRNMAEKEKAKSKAKGSESDAGHHGENTGN